MKTAADWLNRVGETVMLSAFAGSNPPGNETENLIKQIQADALRHAAQLVHDMSRGTQSEDRAVAIDEARDLIADEASKLSLSQGVSAKKVTP
jgi:hypothetical protein